MIKICHRWGFCNVKWNEANWSWNDCQIIDEILNNYDGVDASLISHNQPWQQSKEKKKRLIRLIARIKDEKYDESKEINDDITVSVKDIKLAIKTVSGIDLDIKI